MSPDTEVIESIRNTTRKLNITSLEMQNMTTIERQRISSTLHVSFNGGVGGMKLPLNYCPDVLDLLVGLLGRVGCDRIQVMEFHGPAGETNPEQGFSHYSCTHEAKTDIEGVISCWKHYQKIPIYDESDGLLDKIASLDIDISIPEISADLLSIYPPSFVQKLLYEHTQSTFLHPLSVIEDGQYCIIGFIKVDYVLDSHDICKDPKAMYALVNAIPKLGMFLYSERG